jgi:hypothetical protein
MFFQIPDKFSKIKLERKTTESGKLVSLYLLNEDGQCFFGCIGETAVGYLGQVKKVDLGRDLDVKQALWALYKERSGLGLGFIQEAPPELVRIENVKLEVKGRLGRRHYKQKIRLIDENGQILIQLHGFDIINELTASRKLDMNFPDGLKNSLYELYVGRYNLEVQRRFESNLTDDDISLIRAQHYYLARKAP